MERVSGDQLIDGVHWSGSLASFTFFGNLKAFDHNMIAKNDAELLI